jgi:hypothetical protein
LYREPADGSAYAGFEASWQVIAMNKHMDNVLESFKEKYPCGYLHGYA